MRRNNRVFLILGVGSLLIACVLAILREFNREMNQLAGVIGISVQRAAGIVKVVSAADRLAQSIHTKQGDHPCRYMHSSMGLHGYERGGPYALDHFRLTTGRTDLREFLWQHWHGHKKGVAEARVETVDGGTVRVLYVVQPGEEGRWDIDVELDRPMDPPCVAFLADSLVRVPIANPEEDYPSQTLGLWSPDEIPSKRLPDSEVVNSKMYKLLLVRNNKPASNGAI